MGKQIPSGGPIKKVRKGDTVIVRTGRDKGKRGSILKVMPKEARLIVQGVNLVDPRLQCRAGRSGLGQGDQGGFQDARGFTKGPLRQGFRRSDRLGTEPMATRLQEQYDTVIRSDLQASFNYANPMQIPRLDKVVLNMGVGEAVADSKKIDAAARDMTAISGQKPIIIRARKSVAQFKLREGMTVGSPSPCRGCAISAAFRRAASTARAISRWG